MGLMMKKWRWGVGFMSSKGNKQEYGQLRKNCTEEKVPLVEGEQKVKNRVLLNDGLKRH